MVGSSSPSTDAKTLEVALQPKEKNQWATLFWRLFREKPLGMIGLVLVLALFLTGIFANFLAPEGYNVIHMADRLAPPSAQYLLGTDHLGRDVLSRIIHGARLSMVVGLVATAINTLISVGIGLPSAFYGGKFDLIVQRIVDAWLCFPTLIVLISLMAIMGPGLVQILLVLGINGGIMGVRFIRSLAFAVKENQYVYASTALGARRNWVMMRHILPNILPMIIVIFSMGVGGNIMAEASLSFLGLGLPPPYPSWGAMISGEGRVHMLRSPWVAFWPGLALTLAIFGMNMLGDALRDLLDPRLRGGLGSYRIQKLERLTKKFKGG